MGSGGGRSPQGLKQRTLRTRFLRAPYQEWAALVHGTKRELRLPAQGAISGLWDAPTPVVLYAANGSDQRRHALVVLMNHRREHLHDIAGQPESLRRECASDYKDFQRYWRERTGRPWDALQQVEVFEIAPWGSVSLDTLARGLLDRLYGDFMAELEAAA